MNERTSLLELLRLLAAARLIDAKVFVRDEDGVREVQAHEHALSLREQPRRHHLASV
jgi:hypothetical protein